MQEFTAALQKDKTLFLSQFFKTMMSPQATLDVRADQSVFRQGLTDTLNLNMQFAPAFIQLSWLALRQNDLKTALNYGISHLRRPKFCCEWDATGRQRITRGSWLTGR